MKPPKGSLPILFFADRRAWREWLGEHHATSTGLWMRIGKKASTERSITYDEALEEALCFGWIDGQKQAHDATSWLQRFTPRGPRSIWSKINRAKVERLIDEGRMLAAGVAAVDRARNNGQWDAAYDSVREAAPADDFQRALDASPKAKKFFATLNSQNRYAILHRIQTAKRPETRTRRIAQFVAMLERGETIYPG